MNKAITNWFWSTNLDEELKSLQGRMDRLDAIEFDNRTKVENAEIQPGKKRKREVEWWFKNVNRKKKVLQDIESELKNHGATRKLKSRIERETREVEELVQQGKFPNGVVLDDHASMILRLQTTSLVGEKCPKNIGLILRELKEDDVFVIGVQGMGGVGKTALLKQIHNSLLEDSEFSRHVYWVTASRECSLQKLQIDIGKTLGLDHLHEDVESRRVVLYHKFSELGKSVLILDDIWTHYPADQIGIPLRARGCKIVLTTRSLDVCRRMDCQRVIKVQPLPRYEAWQLFIENVGAIPNDLNPYAEQIVEECGGLPLALITMGRSMRGATDVLHWENAVYELSQSINRPEDMEERVFRLLRFGFDSLNDGRVQQCFLSCVLYPEDEEIKCDELINLWMAEGLLNDRESWRDQENKGYDILDKLINANLLEATTPDDDERAVRMHDLIRDMVIFITQNFPRFMATSGLQLNEMPREELWTRDLVKVSLMWNYIKEIPYGMSPETTNLKVLKLSHNPLKEIPESFFVHMKSLEVLDLSETNIERLPNNVSELENLKALLLDECENLIYVPSVAKLTKLRVLKLVSSKMEEAPRGMEKLVCLEQLKLSLEGLPDLRGLIKLGESETLSPMPSIHPITIVTLSHLKNLIISGCPKMEVVFPAELLQQLQPVLPNLELIHVDDCHVLEEIFASPSPPSGTTTGPTLQLPNLRTLYIRGCPKLKAVFPVKFLQHQQGTLLSNLEKIQVEDCEELEEIFTTPMSCTMPILYPPHLKEIILNSLPKLESIYRGILICTSLGSVDHRECPKFEKLPLS